MKVEIKMDRADEVRVMAGDIAKYTSLDIDVIKDVLSIVCDESFDVLSDISNHGADGGYNGFIYTDETVAFWLKHQKDIVKKLNDDVGEMGLSSAIALVSSFKCLNGASIDSIASVIYCVHHTHESLNEIDDGLMIANALSWYALEDVANAYVSFLEDKENN